jgi:hypothetical protein
MRRDGNDDVPPGPEEIYENYKRRMELIRSINKRSDQNAKTK